MLCPFKLSNIVPTPYMLLKQIVMSILDLHISTINVQGRQYCRKSEVILLILDELDLQVGFDD
jgi:hypothetical protein